MSPSVSGGTAPLAPTPSKFAIGLGIWFFGALRCTSALP
jgi:hypothetical protein